MVRVAVSAKTELNGTMLCGVVQFGTERALDVNGEFKSAGEAPRDDTLSFPQLVMVG
jgi:hypothetical protein